MKFCVLLPFPVANFMKQSRFRATNRKFSRLNSVRRTNQLAVGLYEQSRIVLAKLTLEVTNQMVPGFWLSCSQPRMQLQNLLSHQSLPKIYVLYQQVLVFYNGASNISKCQSPRLIFQIILVPSKLPKMKVSFVFQVDLQNKYIKR